MKKLNSRDIQAAIEDGDEQALDDLSGPSFVKTTKTRQQDEGKEEKKHRERKRNDRRNLTTPEIPTPITEEKEERGGTVMNQGQNQTQERTLSPFWETLQAARQINTKYPREDQPEEFGQLQTAFNKLDEGSKSGLVFYLVKEVLEDKAPIQGLFQVARAAKMMGVAFNTAAVRKAIVQGKASFDQLREAGIVEIKPGEGNKPFFTKYHIGYEHLTKAAQILRETGNNAAAQILEEHLRANERNRALAQAAREAKKANAEAVNANTKAENKIPPADVPENISKPKKRVTNVKKVEKTTKS